jgi:anti-sigma regulatory factor (Ser/Thr protein kinase)
MARTQNPEIRDYILRNAEEFPDSIATKAAKEFGLTRTGIARYMGRLVAEGLLTAQGNTKARRYRLKPTTYFLLPLERDGLWNEDTIWRGHIRPLLNGAKQNAIDIWQYGFTEMLNNVLDHSHSPDVVISFEATYAKITVTIWDHGIGIFNKIQEDFHLEDARTALLELSKGKLTSDKKNHSGEGIYFTSRMFDKFSIMSGHLYYSRTRRDGDDWLIESHDEKDITEGTHIRMSLRTNVDWTTKDIFDKYQGEDLYFRKTHVPIALARYPGEQLVSRSQAKRVLARFPDFSEVLLDFADVPEIGQAFADEIFRVFKNAHPETYLAAFSTSPAVEKMIKYVQLNDATLPLPLSAPKASYSGEAS